MDGGKFRIQTRVFDTTPANAAPAAPAAVACSWPPPPLPVANVFEFPLLPSTPPCLELLLLFLLLLLFFFMLVEVSVFDAAMVGEFVVSDFYGIFWGSVSSWVFFEEKKFIHCFNSRGGGKNDWFADVFEEEGRPDA